MTYFSDKLVCTGTACRNGDDFEILTTALRTRCGSLTLNVVNGYRSPNPRNLSDFLNALDDAHADCRRMGGHLVIAGDFNVDILGNSVNSTPASLEAVFMKRNLRVPITQPTRGASNTLLDIVAVSHGLLVSDVIVEHLPPDFSDHAMVSCKFQVGIAKPTWRQQLSGEPETMVRSFSRSACKNFLAELRKKDWHAFGNAGTMAGQLWKDFRAVWETSIDRCFPLQRPKPRKPYRIPLPAWLISIIRERRRFFKQLSFRGGTVEAIDGCRRQKNDINRTIKRYKLAVIRSEPEFEIMGSQAWWKVVRRHLLGDQMTRTCECLIENARRHTAPVEIANVFVRQFQAMYKQVDTVLPFEHFDSPIAGSCLSNVAVNAEEITALVSKIPNGKANLECLPIRILKQAITLIAQPLATIYTAMVSEGYVPPEFRRARVTAIYKKAVVVLTHAAIDQYLLCRFFPDFGKGNFDRKLILNPITFLHLISMASGVATRLRTPLCA